MKTKDLAQSLEGLPKKEKMAILEVIDLKISNNMKDVIAEIKSFRVVMETKLSALETKYNVLLGMISFLIFALTAVSIFVGLKG